MDHAIIKDSAKVFGWAKVSQYAIISGGGQVSEEAHIGGKVEVRGLVFRDSTLMGDEFISKTTMLPSLRAA